MIYLAVAFAELVVYYRYMNFPIDTLRYFDPRMIKLNKKNCIQTFLQAAQWIYIFFIMGMLLGYVALVLVWAVLGAILNPTAYLYYATAALTLVTFVIYKFREYRKLQNRGIEYLMKVVAQRIKDIMD